MKNIHKAYREDVLRLTTYNAIPLIEFLRGRFDIQTDTQLSVVLNVQPSYISHLRHKKKAISAVLLIRMHELTGMSISALRAMAGDTRPYFE